MYEKLKKYADKFGYPHLNIRQIYRGNLVRIIVLTQQDVRLFETDFMERTTAEKLIEYQLDLCLQD